jgi:xanthine dehydrogenase small subunit
MKNPILQFFHRGKTTVLHDVEPNRTLLEVLREDLQCTGTKEGCGEGDCGACTVVVAEPENGHVRFKAINSCIRLAHSIQGMALWTVEDLAQADGTLHPAQEAMLQCHASQCGFCTPGFVMSLFGLYQQHAQTQQAITREDARVALSGNLCRCTGYRPILDAAESMQQLPPAPLDHAALAVQLEGMQADAPNWDSNSSYLAPRSLEQLLQARNAHPDAQIVAGCTDVGLWITKMHQQYARILDVTRVAELRQIVRHADRTEIGSAVTLNDAFTAVVQQRPTLQTFLQRFAGMPVRNSGTLGGNVANGSPIGDSMPLLIALRSTVTLASVEGERTLPLEQLYTGYRKNCMHANEVVRAITIPHPEADALCRAYKISKRQEDDISAVCLAIELQQVAGKVSMVSIGVGGVAATPVRATQTESALVGQDWSEATVRTAMDCLQREFNPISDMRASADYRKQILDNLLWRFWLESQGHIQTDIQNLRMEESV